MKAQARRVRTVEAVGVSTLLHRAFKLRCRGERRKCMLVLRQACLEHDDSARLWVHYALACAACGKVADAQEALTRALWLRQRCHEEGRIATTRALLEQLDRGALFRQRAA